MSQTKALENIRVLDFTRVLAGPFCTMLLADMGADVVKVEHPRGGDDSRAFGPFVEGESAYFMSINRNKKSITMNLKHPRATELIKKMIPSFDVVVENFRPGVMDKLGIGYEELRKINPRLVYASSSGFGYTGPYSQLPAYDLIVQGMGGIMSITGDSPDNPQKVGSSIGDIFAGVFCAVGILGALQARHSTGRGQMVDVAMLDCQVAILENAVSRFLTTGVDPQPLGNRHPSISPFATFRTQDGFINIAVGNDALWEKFCVLAGCQELITDERFTTNARRTENWEALEPLLAAVMAPNTTESWLGRLRGVGVPCGPINKISQVLTDPQVVARDMILEVAHPKAGKQKIPGCPIKLSETPCSVDTASPVLGEHTGKILAEFLGLPESEVNALKEEGVL